MISAAYFGIRCCEAQERYVLAISAENLNTFKAIADRERSTFRVVGATNGTKRNSHNNLLLTDRASKDSKEPINLPMEAIFGKVPRLSQNIKSRKTYLPDFDSSLSTYLPKIKGGSPEILSEAIHRVLRVPAVASKSFLITIGDRSVGGLVVRDQMVGPWQIPVSDVGITATSLKIGMTTGETIAIGGKYCLRWV